MLQISKTKRATTMYGGFALRCALRDSKQRFLIVLLTQTGRKGAVARETYSCDVIVTRQANAECAGGGIRSTHQCFVGVKGDSTLTKSPAAQDCAAGISDILFAHHWVMRQNERPTFNFSHATMIPCALV